ncbi:hypothetical protein [Actinomyces howellii]|uniref:Uncharacterized protein n=1 Tax=Actinomyces howellii TaxID=52771 RepID=A0A448HGE7_9ACTO|nr:hypothetical protein [Actinomyces howellii]VEG27619.1 Uncharacterised protein [Actinomyces howellii]
MTRTDLLSTQLTRRTAVTAAAAALLLPLSACGASGDAGADGQASPTPSPGTGEGNPLDGFLAGPPELTDEQYETMVEGVAAWVARAWPLMGTVWPGADYTRHRIVAMKVDEEHRAARAWVISTEGHRELTAEEYAGIEPPTSYGKITFEGNPSITLNLGQAASVGGVRAGEQDEGEQGAAPAGSAPQVSATGASQTTADLQDPATYAFALMTHELVHFYYQDEIDFTASSSRDTPYPFDARPRLLRRMMLHRLRQAVLDADTRSQHLGRARYWFDSWTSEYAQEATDIHTYDIAEGVARYVEYMALTIGADQSEEELRARQAPLYEGEVLDVSVDSESYALGFITGVLLDSVVPGWKDGFYAGGTTLVELLLEGVTAVADEADPDVSSQLEDLVREYEAQVGPDVTTIDEAEADTSVAYLRCLRYSEIGYGGSYVHGDKVVLTTTILVLSGEGQDLQVLGAPSFTDNDREVVTIPLVGVSHRYENGVLTVTGDTISGTVPAQRSEESGREVFVVS